MTLVNTKKTVLGEVTPQAILLSVDEAEPIEEGGPIARSGFNYQDEIAVSFLIEMLENPSLLKVHCETHDDILLVRAGQGSVRKAEFVQVKAAERDSLWSVSALCGRTNSRPGTSIYEISLARDRYEEDSVFRIVTLRPVVSDLRILTLPLGGIGREVGSEAFANLQSELEGRFPGLKSEKDNGADFWLSSCVWDQRTCEKSLQDNNLLRLLRLSSEENRKLLPETAEVLLLELRTQAKAAGDAKWVPDRDKKIIVREALRAWWERRTLEIVEGATATSGGKLRDKMRDAMLPPDMVELAVDMRRDYSAVSRTSQYMQSEEREELQRRVKSEVMSLRSGLVAGQIDLDGVGFHALCLARMDLINDERPPGSQDRSAFLKGCVYDIADRCLIRFVRSTQ